MKITRLIALLALVLASAMAVFAQSGESLEPKQPPEKIWAEFMEMKPKPTFADFREIYQWGKAPYKLWAAVEINRWEGELSSEERVLLLKTDNPPEPIARKNWERLEKEAMDDQLVDVACFGGGSYNLQSAKVLWKRAGIEMLAKLIRCNSGYSNSQKRFIADESWKGIVSQNPPNAFLVDFITDGGYLPDVYSKKVIAELRTRVHTMQAKELIFVLMKHNPIMDDDEVVEFAQAALASPDLIATNLLYLNSALFTRYESFARIAEQRYEATQEAKKRSLLAHMFK